MGYILVSIGKLIYKRFQEIKVASIGKNKTESIKGWSGDLISSLKQSI